MSKSEYYTILTKIGIAKFIAARASGNGINLQSFKLSSKVILPSEEMQSLEEIVYEANINSKSVDENNPNYINLMCYVPSDIGGFEINAIGIYDEVGDLLAVGNLPRTYKPILKEGSAKELMIKIVMELSNAEEVILKLDPSVIMASRDYVDAIKIELELKIETLKEELKALINTKEDKGVAANLDKALKTELTKLINKKENTGTAASLDAQLRDELIALINKKENIGVAKQLVDALRSELTKEIKSFIPELRVEKRIITAKYDYDRKKRQTVLVSLSNIPSEVNMSTYLSKCANSGFPEIAPNYSISQLKGEHLIYYLNDQYAASYAYQAISYAPSGSTNNNNY
ncbi:tail fiber protein H, putative [Campylobacter coli 2685]|uniref:phage tail protein n=1 Tax=Campylobacter coli TaxID=195 RepID=UPI0002582D4A|nr:phage tail protein [Campylobacter coli]EAH7116483.1 phage tail protein [Campylobacter coli]EAI1284339.1 phage tail protein [Campylobacter coli]EAI2953509.1 phage tail protein [Campylobacter coli]EAK6613551.1 phage tail protein [Campylobacter coli]EAL7242216.1 phage tail protein [Campylobacter coli]